MGLIIAAGLVQDSGCPAGVGDLGRAIFVPGPQAGGANRLAEFERPEGVNVNSGPNHVGVAVRSPDTQLVLVPVDEHSGQAKDRILVYERRRDPGPVWALQEVTRSGSQHVRLLIGALAADHERQNQDHDSAGGAQ
jgi:hypothetical protein